MQSETEVWYEIQYSAKGENDWFSTNTLSDTIEGAKTSLQDYRNRESIEYRIVKVTHILEPQP